MPTVPTLTPGQLSPAAMPRDVLDGIDGLPFHKTEMRFPNV